MSPEDHQSQSHDQTVAVEVQLTMADVPESVSAIATEAEDVIRNQLTPIAGDQIDGVQLEQVKATRVSPPWAESLLREVRDQIQEMARSSAFEDWNKKGIILGAVDNVVADRSVHADVPKEFSRTKVYNTVLAALVGPLATDLVSTDQREHQTSEHEHSTTHTVEEVIEQTVEWGCSYHPDGSFECDPCPYCGNDELFNCRYQEGGQFVGPAKRGDEDFTGDMVADDIYGSELTHVSCGRCNDVLLDNHE